MLASFGNTQKSAYTEVARIKSQANWQSESVAGGLFKALCVSYKDLRLQRAGGMKPLVHAHTSTLCMPCEGGFCCGSEAVACARKFFVARATVSANFCAVPMSLTRSA